LVQSRTAEIEPGIIHSPPNLPGWTISPEELLRKMRLPVHVEHDGNAGALAEWYFGAARGARNSSSDHGTGFGGVCSSTATLPGTCDLAASGHIRIAESGRWPSARRAVGRASAAEQDCEVRRPVPKRWKTRDVTRAGIAVLATAATLMH